jgi:hypothetical protein
VKATLAKRLSWIELALTRHDDRDTVVIDFSVFSDDDLDRLEWFAIRRAGWPGNDWVESGLMSGERRELDALQAKVK